MKPSLPKGIRDFLPSEVVRRKYMFGIIEEVFRRYGYAPIETPTMENLETLTGKYGEEGERLLFKVLNNGDFLKKADKEALAAKDSYKLIPSISKRGLRYDLTVPFARYVVMHRNELSLPFKRYQIQPVWRADRPQKGRYQEFYQCDVDVVGSQSLLYEAELVQIYDEVFHRLGLDVHIRINHRKILAGIAQICGIEDKLTDMTVAIDKLDKIGEDGVRGELASRDIDESVIDRIMEILKVNSPEELLPVFEGGLSADGQEGTREILEVISLLQQQELHNPCIFDVQLARGLDYYTGCIFEVDLMHEDVSMGSLGGGGRYDNLTEVFGMSDVPGVGISFGAERIYDVLAQTNGFPAHLRSAPDLLMMSLDQETLYKAFYMTTSLRQEGITADCYPEPAKLGKQMKYADAIGVPFAGIVGFEELAEGEIMLKNMKSGEQRPVSLTYLIDFLKKSPARSFE